MQMALAEAEEMLCRPVALPLALSLFEAGGGGRGGGGGAGVV